MTPERLAEIKHYAEVLAHPECSAEDYATAALDYIRVDVLPLLAEVGRLQEQVERQEARYALAQGVIDQMTRTLYEVGDRADRFKRALEQIARDTERGARHELAPYVAIQRLARDVLDG